MNMINNLIIEGQISKEVELSYTERRWKPNGLDLKLCI